VSETWRGVLADIERTMTATGRARTGLYSIEGIRLHERAIRAGAPIAQTLISRRLESDPSDRVQRLLAALDDGGCAVHPTPDEIVDRLTDGRGSGDLVGLVPLPTAPDLSTLLTRTGETAALLLVADTVEDPGNVGALVRTALASGCAGLICIGATDPYHPRAVRTSMGSLFKLSPVRFVERTSALAALRACGVRSWGALSRGGVAPGALGPTDRPTALWIGGEAFGLAPELVEELDGVLTIPMPDGVDSYSVNAAAAILLHQLRQRTGQI
jgi:tRNA G18 (ribose-2'-O)-methylase SpoU